LTENDGKNRKQCKITTTLHPQYASSYYPAYNQHELTTETGHYRLGHCPAEWGINNGLECRRNFSVQFHVKFVSVEEGQVFV
jgi:hypothetical protein